MHRTASFSPRFFNHCVPALLALLVVSQLAYCAEKEKFVRLVIQPEAITLSGSGDEQGVLVSAVTESGRSVDVTTLSKFNVRKSKTITFSPAGICTASEDGEAEVSIEYKGLKARLKVTATQTAVKTQPSFRQDVLPVLTKAGCNSGACHGKLAGQNGFRLSLRGYAPEWDHEWLTTEVAGRRVNLSHPADSLLLLKPLGAVPHEGGKKLSENSREHRLLVDWIAARAPGPVSGEADPARLEVFPGDRTMKVGEKQRLLVRAHYADGRVRDVTWLSQFFSNDETVVSVSQQGLVTALRPGAAGVRVHFQNHVEVLIFTTPHEYKVAPDQYTAKNNFIDEHVFGMLQKLRIPPSENCSDAAFIRRAFLDATGTLPTPEEVRTFANDTSSNKRAQLIDRLLERPEFVDYWTLQLADLLQNRRERDHDVRGTKGVRAFQAWLRAQVAANRPWNELARDVLTAKGDSVSHPAIGYFITTIGEKSAVEDSEIADSVAQSFLGTRIGCAKCHNHPLEKYTQDDYYHFAAFFSRVSLMRQDPAKNPTVLFAYSREEAEHRKQIRETEKKLSDAEAEAKAKSGDEATKAAAKIAEHKKRLEDLNKQLPNIQKRPSGVTQPRTRKFLPPQPLDRNAAAVAPEQDPREALASWITDPKNEMFSGSMVNRIWKHYMGVGLVELVDDLRSSNPPSNPELWKALNHEFVSHNFDRKHIMRLILNSRAYQLSSETVAGNEIDRQFYSHYYARRLPAEVLLDAISQATNVPDQFAGYPVGTRATQLPEPGVNSYFMSLFGRSERVTACACERSGEVSLPQLLHLQNSEELVKKIRAKEGRLDDLLKKSVGDEQFIEEIFLSTVSRRPDAKELAAVKAALAAGDNRDEVLRDLFWALLNSKEFAFNH
ncbi:MAG TPA: DUF1549 domain-containing protein [Planctomycetota bacterium]|nr:DUF1549 domain-containing protein [Planctomycetota bacterium]